MTLDFSKVTAVTILEGAVSSIKLASTVLWQAVKKWTGYPIICDGSRAKAFVDVKLYGNSEQEGTPSITTPKNIDSVGDYVGVPYEYTLLESIHTDGQSYIDTGFKANTTTTRFVGEFVVDELVTARGLLGSRQVTTTTNTTACNLFIVKTGIRADWVYAVSSQILTGISAGEKFTIDVTRPTVKVNDTTYTSTITDSVDQDYNFFIGSVNNAGTPYENNITGDIFPCKIYSNNVLIRDYLPAKRNSDSVCGLYDTLNDVFYPSASDTAFTAGTEISQGGYKLPIKCSNSDGTQTTTTNLYLSQPLRKIGNFADVIDIQGTNVVVTRKVESEIIQCLGNSTTVEKGWAYTSTSQVWYSNYYFKNNTNIPDVKILCIDYPCMTGVKTASGVTDGYVATAGSDSSSLYRLYIKDTTNAPTTYNEFKTWIDELGAKIIYPLASSTEEQYTLPNTINGYASYTKIETVTDTVPTDGYAQQGGTKS